MVIYNDKIYQCVKSHTSIETWAPSIWTKSLWVKINQPESQQLEPQQPQPQPSRTIKVILEIDLDTGKIININ